MTPASAAAPPSGEQALTILMPVFNERATVARAIERVLAVELPTRLAELLVVDDGSTDGSRELLAQTSWPEPVRVVRRERNGGKGAAVRTGLTHATGELVAIFDADLEYDPADLPALLAPLLSGETNVVFGARGFRSHSAYGFWYVLGNRAVTLAGNVLYNAWLSDVMCCLKVVRTDLMRSLELRESGFAIEPEIAARLLRAGERIYEVPVAYRARTREEGKKLTALDGVRVLATLLRCRVG
jgi:glycosyltransferase involved in cell wall biosynthesis